jgi:hypothetical protein
MGDSENNEDCKEYAGACPDGCPSDLNCFTVPLPFFICNEKDIAFGGTSP